MSETTTTDYLAEVTMWHEWIAAQNQAQAEIHRNRSEEGYADRAALVEDLENRARHHRTLAAATQLHEPREQLVEAVIDFEIHHVQGVAESIRADGVAARVLQALAAAALYRPNDPPAP
jgi:hypothetical protein